MGAGRGGSAHRLCDDGRRLCAIWRILCEILQQAVGAGDGGPRLHAWEIGGVYEALVGGWRRLRDGAKAPPFPRVQSFPAVATSGSDSEA